jgi:hypothetical protein
VEYATDKDYPQVALVTITPGFFATFGVEMFSGRDFGDHDDSAAPPVAIVNRSFAERFFPGQEAIGRTCRIGDSTSDAPWRTIIGIVPDLYTEGLTGLSEHHPSGIYVPVAQRPPQFISIAVRGLGSAEQLIAAIRTEVAATHADTPIYWARSMSRALREEIWYVDLFGGIFAVFGGLALLLSAAGLYAVMATGVAQRTREVGIRMAVGASAGKILTMVLRQGAVQVATGLVFGLALAGLTSRGLQALLFGVQAWDLSVFAAIAAVMIASGLAASLIPARRAVQVDPARALRVS